MISKVDSNELLELQVMAVAAAANAIVITDSDGVIVSVNPAFTRLTGFSAAEAIGRTPAILKSGAQDPAMYRELWASIRAGRVWRGRLVNRRKDGSVYTEDQTITPVTSEAGVVTHFIAVKQDVTEFREVYERLQARDDLFRLLLEHALDIITILTVDGTIRYESPAVLRTLGYEPHELEGRSAFRFMPDEDVANGSPLVSSSCAPPVATAIAGVPFSPQGRFLAHPRGHRAEHAGPSDARRHPHHSRDVTERRRIDDELRSAGGPLPERQLADMGTLLAGVAHELNNPLTVVTGYSALLRDALGDGPFRSVSTGSSAPRSDASGSSEISWHWRVNIH